MAVYAVLQRTKDHPNVEMIYRELKPNYPAISLATVYKTVDILKKVGLIQELSFGEGGLRYDSVTLPHAHIFCRNCGKVVDIESISPERLRELLLMESVAEETGFHISSMQLYFYGLCLYCNNKQSES